MAAAAAAAAGGAATVIHSDERIRKDTTVRIQEPEKEAKPRLSHSHIDSGVAGTSSLQRQTSTTTGGTKHDKEKKIGHRRVDDTGQVTYKKRTIPELEGCLQLGVGQSVGALGQKPVRDLLLCDFAVVDEIFYPREGSNLTPAHHYSDFRFKTYAPIAFRYFRELFGIQPDDFLLSMCNEALIALTNPGASGSIFYITNDDEFIIKTVQHKEAEFLQKLLPGYYMNLNQNPRTLLPKFYGLYCYQCGGKNIRFCVMNNLLPSNIKLHEKYDLKGSTYKRKASKRERAKKCPTLKDLDFVDLHPEGLMLEAETFSALLKTIERDCRVLQSFKIMDYSLLLGVHNLDLAIKEREQQVAEQAISEGGVDGDPGQENALSRGRSVRQRIAAYSTAMEAIQAQSEPVELDNEEDVPPGGIPARNARGERLLLYIGIIDILQSYHLKKKLEHAFKSAVHDGDTISVHRPGFYSNRFQEFFGNKVFKKIPSPLKHSPSKKKSVGQRQRSVTTTEIEEDKAGVERVRANTTASSQETGAIGGRPDLLPDTGTPPHSHSDSNQYNSPAYTPPTYTKMTSHLTSTTRHHIDSRLDPGSPALSVAESTPTHTEYTEGTPSFTTSSPSCSSDMLDTPQSTRGGDATRISHSQTHEVSTEQIHVDVSTNRVAVETAGIGQDSFNTANLPDEVQGRTPECVTYF